MCTNELYLNQSIANEAVEIAINTFRHLIQPKGTENGFLPNGGGLRILVGHIGQNNPYSHDYLDPKDWPGDYSKHAKSKFDLTFQHHKPASEIQEKMPLLAENVGVTYYGGSWIESGIIVACSGVDPEWDEAISRFICILINTMLTKKRKLEMATGKHFRSI